MMEAQKILAAANSVKSTSSKFRNSFRIAFYIKQIDSDDLALYLESYDAPSFYDFIGITDEDTEDTIKTKARSLVAELLRRQEYTLMETAFVAGVDLCSFYKEALAREEARIAKELKLQKQDELRQQEIKEKLLQPK